MGNNDLTQVEADRQLNLKKSRVNDNQYTLPKSGERLTIPLKGLETNDEFVLHLYSGRIELKQNTFQIQTKTLKILARVDLYGPMHRNPDGEEIACPHIHVYREGFDDKWAMSLPVNFINPNDPFQTFEDFLSYCHVVNKPYFVR